MICRGCAQAADVNAKVVAENEKHGGKNVILVPHPDDCKCPCMHKAPGAWKGEK